MQDVALASYETYHQLAAKLKRLKPSSYAAESVTDLVQDWYRIANPLALAGHYQPSFTFNLITAALSAGGNSNHPDLL